MCEHTCIHPFLWHTLIIKRKCLISLCGKKVERTGVTSAKPWSFHSCPSIGVCSALAACPLSNLTLVKSTSPCIDFRKDRRSRCLRLLTPCFAATFSVGSHPFSSGETFGAWKKFSRKQLLMSKGTRKVPEMFSSRQFNDSQPGNLPCYDRCKLCLCNDALTFVFSLQPTKSATQFIEGFPHSCLLL